MQAFKDYLISEYRPLLPNVVGVEFKFSHGRGVKRDKKSKETLRVDSIKVSMRFFDKDMNMMLSRDKGCDED